MRRCSRRDSLRRWLTPDTSELSRRPCWGMSMAGKSVAGMVGALGGPASAGQELAKLFSSKAGSAALAGLKDLEYDAHRHDPSALHQKFLHIFEFFKAERKKLHDLLPKSQSTRQSNIWAPRTPWTCSSKPTRSALGPANT